MHKPVFSRMAAALAAMLVAGGAFGAGFAVSDSARRRAADFIANEKQFHLGFLPTERSNPFTAGLERDFKKSTLAGIECLQRADRQMPLTLRHSFASAEFRALVDAIEAVMRSGKGRVVFSGCGATGRLAIVLESMWRDFFARRGDELGEDAAALADKAASIMTGGDFALIRSVEAFEDYASGGARQAEELGVGPDDVMVAITEGGETSSVLGTLMYAAGRGAKCFLVFNNPREILRANIERSRQAIDDKRVTVVDLYCGSMALAGSTRMQATSSEQLFVSAALETALVRLFPQLAAESSADWTEDFERLLSQLESEGARAGIAAAIDFEEGVYREGGRITYYSDDCMLDLFTDTTERSPTFMLPPFRGTRESAMAQSWAFVKNPFYETEECWRRLLHRAPRCLDWGSETYRELGFPERVVASSPKIATDDFYTYQIGRENPEARTAGAARSVAVAVTVTDRPEAFLRAAKAAAAKHSEAVALHLGEGAPDGFAVPIKIKRSPLEVWKHLAVKLVFNTISTGTMVRMGRVSGNWMSWVSISNKKLIDRGIRLLSELGHIPYAEAAERLFAAQEWIGAQEWGGKEIPCAVQVALDQLNLRVKGVNKLKTVWGEQVAPDNAWRLYPRPQMERGSWQCLNGLWDYAIEKCAFAARGFPEKWAGKILVPFAIESPLSGVERLTEFEELIWYRRKFTLDRTAGERTLLNFEQVDFRATAFVNGREVGLPHDGGMVPFSYDITPFVHDGENELVVAVWDPTTGFVGATGKQVLEPYGWMYTRSSGITGTVWLEQVPQCHLRDYRVSADPAGGDVTITLSTSESPRRARADVAVGFGGKRLAAATNVFCDGEIVLRVPAPHRLWSPETPDLYDLEIEVYPADDPARRDRVRGYFGMRSFTLQRDRHGALRFCLNGRPRFIIGTLDQGWWPDGFLTPPSEAAMVYDITTLKRMGFDTIRKHLKVEPRRYYALCDRLGMIVLQDMASGAGNLTARYSFYRREWASVIDTLCNTPSIVMWVPYNEGWGQPGEFMTRQTLLWTMHRDPTRLVDGPSGWQDYEGGVDRRWVSQFAPGGQKPDPVDRNTYTAHKPDGVEEGGHIVDRHDYDPLPAMHPAGGRRASFLGEFGGIGCRVEGHLWTDSGWGYGGTGGDSDRQAVETKYLRLMDHLATLAEKGLAGSIYTQTTDVEGEINGLITYDRKVEKFDAAKLAAAHERVREAFRRSVGQ